MLIIIAHNTNWLVLVALLLQISYEDEQRSRTFDNDIFTTTKPLTASERFYKFQFFVRFFFFFCII